ncbi:MULTISPECIES: MATE family efflux transporter [unclassified Oceanispirochaeta]|uniref:MATE family efflux transporter n=1 Tax=unclassified Oceanispirochaeta TaxID=2635722 RepID=UPI000E092821|nr:MULTISPECIES: MATE family efflux transporter [unclassified Oceanispirochaeta]MBF9014977.1 MATE family efflux transporter [Oceanispirochaeta sp. M2]NPD71342.1 MATE family efflux transporter [Oceanispirochaeta sp. M1]RDG33308.1 MATE family efflux transporter [Oceanispirochaeta sp. M1]
MTKTFDLGKDPVGKIFTGYAIPGVLGMMAMSAAGIIDGIFIGRYVGTSALAAVNLINPIASLAIGLSIMIGVGGATTAAAELGAGNVKGARNSYTVTILLITVLALIITVAGLIFIDPIVRMLGAEGALAADVKEYLGSIILFFLFFMLSFLLDSFIRSDGSPVFSVAILLGSSVLNIIMDYFFVARFGWGLRGAAFATGFSQLIAVVFLWAYMISGKTRYKLVHPRFEIRRLGKMLFNGSSELINELSLGISTLVFNYILLSRLGSIGVAAYSVVGYGAMLAKMIFGGVAQAVQPGISYNLGAGNLKRIKAFLKLGLGVNLVTGVLAFVAMLVLRRPLAVLFAGNQTEVVELTVKIALLYSFSLLVTGSNFVLSMFFTAVHRAADSAVIAFSRSLLFFLLGLFVLPMFFGDNGLWLTTVFAESLTLITALLLVKFRPLNEDQVNRLRSSLQKAS